MQGGIVVYSDTSSYIVVHSITSSYVEVRFRTYAVCAVAVALCTIAGGLCLSGRCSLHVAGALRILAGVLCTGATCNRQARFSFACQAGGFFSPLEQICTFACWILIKAILVDFMVEGPCFSGRHRGPVLLPWLARQGLPNPVVTSCDILWLWGLRCGFQIK